MKRFLVVGFLLVTSLAVASPAHGQGKNWEQQEIILQDSDDKTPEFFLNDKCLAGIHADDTMVTTDITYECAEKTGGDFQPASDSTGTLITLVTDLSSNDYIDLTFGGKMLCGCVWVKLVAVTNQTTDRTFVIFKGR